MKLHALFAAHNQLYTAEVFCYCDACLKGEYCGHWKIDNLPEKHNVRDEASARECSLKRKSIDHEGNVDENRNKVLKLNVPETCANGNGSSQIADENVLPKVSDKNEPPSIKPVKDAYYLVNWDDIITQGKFSRLMMINRRRQFYSWRELDGKEI
ncbi:hypothetical protein DPMN_133955 [Dreissena polymorpha]|uniref:Uncharacterized protein n=1 Tax=Dreissena polymorpha TaxID=45954 RepID=A0A9D4FZ90_DREPO|nr:hypothetical protein DPMN_133955 [Dreissena polymorpha]